MKCLSVPIAQILALLSDNMGSIMLHTVLLIHLSLLELLFPCLSLERKTEKGCHDLSAKLTVGNEEPENLRNSVFFSLLSCNVWCPPTLAPSDSKSFEYLHPIEV